MLDERPGSNVDHEQQSANRADANGAINVVLPGTISAGVSVGAHGRVYLSP